MTTLERPDEPALPPDQRTPLGLAFNRANADGTLSLQFCQHCDSFQYPPRELCQHCLAGDLVWREADSRGHVLSRIELHHSLSEFYRRRISEAPWPIAAVKMECGAGVFAHLALHSFEGDNALAIKPGTSVQVFSHADCSGNPVLIAVSETSAIQSLQQRAAIAKRMGLLDPAT